MNYTKPSWIRVAVIGILVIGLAGAMWYAVSNMSNKKTKTSNDSNKKAHTDIINEVSYITKIYQEGSRTFMDLDYVQWLTGDVAQEIAFNDGICPKREDCAPNRIYIRNLDTAVNTFEVSPNVSVTRASDFENNQSGEKEINLTELTALFAADNAQFQGMPFAVTIENGVIKQIKEKFVP